MSVLKEGLFIVMGKKTPETYMICMVGKNPFLKIVRAISVTLFKDPKNSLDVNLSDDKITEVMEKPDDYHFYQLDEILEKNYVDLNIQSNPKYKQWLSEYRTNVIDGHLSESQFITELSSKNPDIPLMKAQEIVQEIKKEKCYQ
jgi:hypothetical protein